MSDSSMQTELLLSFLLLFLRAGLYQNHPVWPVTSAQQLFLQGQGLELPHSDARKWDSAPPPPISQIEESHSSFHPLPAAQKWKVRTQLMSEASDLQKEAGPQERRGIMGG